MCTYNISALQWNVMVTLGWGVTLVWLFKSQAELVIFSENHFYFKKQLTSNDYSDWTVLAYIFFGNKQSQGNNWQICCQWQEGKNRWDMLPVTKFELRSKNYNFKKQLCHHDLESFPTIREFSEKSMVRQINIIFNYVIT